MELKDETYTTFWGTCSRALWTVCCVALAWFNPVMILERCCTNCWCSKDSNVLTMLAFRSIVARPIGKTFNSLPMLTCESLTRTRSISCLTFSFCFQSINHSSREKFIITMKVKSADLSERKTILTCSRKSLGDNFRSSRCARIVKREEGKPVILSLLIRGFVFDFARSLAFPSSQRNNRDRKASHADFLFSKSLNKSILMGLAKI